MLYSALHSVVRQHPSNIALRHDGQELTYDALWQLSEQRASQLRCLGVDTGDRVAILAENSLDAVVLQWAIYKCHAIVVYLNEQLKPSGLLQILEDAEPVFVIYFPAKLREKLPEKIACPDVELARLGVATNSGGTLTGLATDLEPKQTSDLEFDSDTNLIASIIYTSGSTGTPKGVCLTHANLLSVAEMAADGYNTTADDSYLMVVPLHYIHGLMILLAMQLRGASIEFINSFLFPGLITRKLQESRVTGFSGVPYHFSALIEKGGFLDAALPSLRWIGVTGGTITPDRLQQIRKAQPALEIHISYGQTECSPRITLLHPDKIDSKPTSVGQVANGLTVELLDDDGEPVGPEGVGELVVSGPNVMQGYWRDPENTSRVIDEQGRLHTGDLACIDAEGDLFIKGRKQAMIKSAGERIFPEELEALINQHPHVADVAVVGVDDVLYGQRVEAHVVFHDSASQSFGDSTAITYTDSTSARHTEEERVKALQDYCLAQLPFARAPRQYHVWPEFPLKANGKTDKQKLMADTDVRRV